jgi:hypothetical protein
MAAPPVFSQQTNDFYDDAETFDLKGSTII